MVGSAAQSGGEARAEDAAVTASMQCERVAEAGRVKCSIEARARGGRSIAWADVVLVSLPDFMSALKGRLGPTDATYRDPSAQKWAFGLIARKPGEGEAEARVRLVVCAPVAADAAAPKCTPMTLEVRTLVHVG